MHRRPVYEFGPFRLDTGMQVLWRGAELVRLTPKALSLLEVLVEAAGDVVSKASLLTRVWPDTVVEEANLSVTVALLRKQLDPRPEGGSWIQTVARRGYRFDAPVTGRRRRSAIALAVLPFTCVGPDPEPHLGLGMADALINRLSGLDGLLVRPLGAVSSFAASRDPGADPGRELGVDVTVQGTVQRAGGRARVSAQLVPHAEGLAPWADRFDAPAEDLFALQDSVSQRIVEALRPRLTDTGPGPRRPAYRPQPQAYEAYLRGRYLWSRLDLDGLSRAAGHLAEAVRLDPDFPAAFAALADVHTLIGFAGLVAPQQALRTARECVETALARQPDLAEAHVSAAWIRLFLDRDWKAAARGLEHAIALEPAAPALKQWLGLLRALEGDQDSARRLVAEAREADPLSAVANTLTAALKLVEGDHEGVVAIARRNVELHPDRFLGHWWLGIGAVHTGRRDEALQALRRAVSISADGPNMRCALAWAHARFGETERARELLEPLDAAATSVHVSAYQRAGVFLALGERRTALERLEQAARDSDPWMLAVGVDPDLAPLRDEPRFRDLVKRVRGPS